MDIELKFNGPDCYKGTYRGVEFTVKKDGEGRFKWRIHHDGVIRMTDASRHEAVRCFMHWLDLELMALPPEADALFDKLTQRIKAAAGSPSDMRAVLKLEQLSHNLEDMWTSIRRAVHEIEEFEADRKLVAPRRNRNAK